MVHWITIVDLFLRTPFAEDLVGMHVCMCVRMCACVFHICFSDWSLVVYKERKPIRKEMHTEELVALCLYVQISVIHCVDVFFYFAVFWFIVSSLQMDFRIMTLLFGICIYHMMLNGRNREIISYLPSSIRNEKPSTFYQCNLSHDMNVKCKVV